MGQNLLGQNVLFMAEGKPFAINARGVFINGRRLAITADKKYPLRLESIKRTAAGYELVLQSPTAKSVLARIWDGSKPYVYESNAPYVIPAATLAHYLNELANGRALPPEDVDSHKVEFSLA
jgi:hypothetical protein